MQPTNIVARREAVLTCQGIERTLALAAKRHPHSRCGVHIACMPRVATTPTTTDDASVSQQEVSLSTPQPEVFASQSGEVVHIETSSDGSTTFHFGSDVADVTPPPDAPPSTSSTALRASGSDAPTTFGSSPPSSPTSKRHARTRSVRSSSMLINAPVSAAGFVRAEGPPHPTTHIVHGGTDVERMASTYVGRLSHMAPPLPRSFLDDDVDDEGDWDTDLHTDLPPLPGQAGVPGSSSSSYTQTVGVPGDTATPEVGRPRKRVDVGCAESLFLLRSFSDLARLGQLEKAKRLVEEIVKGGRHDVLQRLRHRHFLKAAAQRKAVKQAFRFVQVLPRQYVDTRTYNMLVSVCVAAKDLRGAMAAADMLVSTGGKLDTRLYTNLITACARVGAVEQAFELYADMKQDRVKIDSHTCSALISCCTRAIERNTSADRRHQIVLMERAFAVLDDMYRMHITPDTAVWNALIKAAGCTGMLDRAMQVVRDMHTEKCEGDGVTYVSLVDACARVGRTDLALDMYHLALKAGVTGCIQLYAAAIGACSKASPTDIDTALEIYHDSRRHCVKPDALLFGSLMIAAGRAGQLQLVFDLQGSMEAQGVAPSQETHSAVILACTLNGDLSAARAAYDSARTQGICPSIQACNSLLNAYARACRLGEVVSLLADMMRVGVQPDAVTYAAVLNTCQRVDAAELAFEVVRVMKERGVKMEESHCFILLRLCYNRLRASWTPGGYPPRAPEEAPHSPLAIDRSQQQEGRTLLSLLSNGTTPATSKQGVYDCSRSKWVSRAVAVYREALTAGMHPSMRVLDRLLACLRQPNKADAQDSSSMPWGLDYEPIAMRTPPPTATPTTATTTQRRRRQSKTPEALFDPRAVTLLEAAIFSGALPQFKLDGNTQVDMRGMPPGVAEVYLLAVLNALQRRAGSLKHLSSPVTLLVPAYHPRDVFWPSYACRDEEEDRDAGMGVSTKGVEEAYEGGVQGSAGEATALGVAGILRNLGIRYGGDAAVGKIVLRPKELHRWLRDLRRMQQRANSAGPSSSMPPQGLRGGGLQRNARKSTHVLPQLL